ncbi:tyrosine-type recombinase/integrase [Kaistia granuli]|uniref:tyrosine-type recombinase/integrase n=1 Tax=Kaistia granuli TaxID=363259 RepID=UPI0003714C2A|nr:tyrosine-type recombinase/integrase [Kaistia granuli]
MPLKLARRGKSPYWYLRGTVRGISVFESTGTDSEEAAEAIRIQREASLLEQSVYGKKATVSFLEAAVSYMAAGGSPRFLGQEKNGRWTGLIGHFAERRLHTIGQEDLTKVAEKLMPGVSAATQNRQVYTPFVAVWNHAVANKWADERRWLRPRKAKGTALKPPTKRSGTRPVSYEKAAEFVGAMSPAPAFVMTALFYTGMRPIELFSLDADEDDIRPHDRWLVLSATKTGAERGVPIHDFVAPLFSALLKRGGRLFRTPRGGAYPMTEDGGGQLSSAIEGARGRTWITNISPYTARHSVSTQLVINGVHPHIKDQILGHAATEMSRVYSHLPNQPLIDAINTLPVPVAWSEMEWISDPLKHAGRLVKNGSFRAKSVQYRLKKSESEAKTTRKKVSR